MRGKASCRYAALDCNENGDTLDKINFDPKSLERACTDEREMKKQRADIAAKLRRRMKAMEAAPNLAALRQDDPGGKWHPLSADRAGYWAAWVSPNKRLIIRPEGATDPAEVTVVTVVAVGEDYHSGKGRG
jgi:proteic killer suppression protein